MTSSFVNEAMHRFFGESWTRTGKTDLTFVRPVRDGDTLNIHATVKEKVQDGNKTRVVFDVYAENQNGDKTAIGNASAVA